MDLCYSESLTGFLNVKLDAVLCVTQFIIILVTRIKVIVTLKVLNQRFVSNGVSLTNSTVLLYDCPPEEYRIGIRELLLLVTDRCIGHVVSLE